MIQRVFIVTLAVVLFMCCSPINATAAPESFRIEQAQAELPRVDVWLASDNGDFAGADISARLNNAALSLVELRPFDAGKDATAYYFIIDCSTSVTAAHMEAVREILTVFSENMGQNDTVTLITFGVEVSVVLNREKNAGAIAGATADLTANQRGTLFFEALAKAQELADNSNYALERKLAFVFSDSDDYALGSTTKDEVERMTGSGNLTFYALGFDNGSKAGLDYFGALARSSGGTIGIVSARSMTAVFDNMLMDIKNVWMARFEADSNIVSASEKELIVTVNDTGVSSIRTIPTRFWRPDNDPPAVISVEQLTSKSIRLQLSKPVDGATSPESYAVSGPDGNLLGVHAAVYDENDNSVILTFSDSPRSGLLTVDCPGLTDISMERNKVSGSVEITFSGTDPAEPSVAPPAPPPPPAPDPESTPIAAWIFICIFAAAIITAIAVGAVRKGKKREGATAGMERVTIGQSGSAHELQVHFANTGRPPEKIRLNVTDASGQSRTVEVPVNKTLFVGRSDICDVFFDDKTMSRQHFVIGDENGVYTISNLSESGGTLLNGVPVQKTRPLKDGDTIRAGQQTIVFFRIPMEGAR